MIMQVVSDPEVHCVQLCNLLFPIPPSIRLGGSNKTFEYCTNLVQLNYTRLCYKVIAYTISPLLIPPSRDSSMDDAHAILRYCRRVRSDVNERSELTSLRKPVYPKDKWKIINCLRWGKSLKILRNRTEQKPSWRQCHEDCLLQATPPELFEWAWMSGSRPTFRPLVQSDWYPFCFGALRPHWRKAGLVSLRCLWRGLDCDA